MAQLSATTYLITHSIEIEKAVNLHNPSAQLTSVNAFCDDTAADA
jgi:hypothetical protein